MRYSLLVLNLFLVCMLGYGQDTINSLPEVSVSALEINRLKTLDLTSQTFNREQILLTQPEDLGVIIQKFSGTTLKSYGGVGGLKTVSVRGLGSQHTTFIVDGFSISNTQTGQINLGQIQTDNVESITLSVGGKNGFLLSPSSYINGSTVSVYTFENSFSTDPFKMRFSSKVGSFGEIDNYISLKYGKEKIFMSAFGKYRSANGKYPYSIQNGETTYNGIRDNNDLVDWYSGFTVGFRLKKEGRLRVICRTNGADQGLPGAIILYNTTANQRLSTQASVVNIDYSQTYKMLFYRLFGSYNHDWLHYTDPYFLNNMGGISAIYTNNLYQGGISFQRLLRNSSTFFGGLETKYSDLTFSTLNAAAPRRLHTFGLIGLNLNRETWKSEVQISAQQIIEENDQGERGKNRLKVNPFLSLEKVEFGKWKWILKAWYRNSFRMPSFNELYYNGVGNTKLKPEQAHQFSLGISARPLEGDSKLNILVNGFANRVENQILAIPTKNLFVWSMQNIGFVNTFGFESRMQINTLHSNRLTTNFTLNYTYQYSVDVSDSHSPTYMNQVAYIPKHSGNFDATIQRKKTGIHFSTTLSSLRYSLTENIIANKIDGFAIMDVSLFTQIKLPVKHALRIQLSVKNIFNSSYAYMRYFVMPGRNYLITLSYAIN